MYEIENAQQEEGSGGSVMPFILGFAAGVVATVAFAVYANDQFNTVIRKTRQASDKVADTAVDISKKVVDRARDVADTAKDQIDRAREHANA